MWWSGWISGFLTAGLTSYMLWGLIEIARSRNGSHHLERLREPMLQEGEAGHGAASARARPRLLH